jgi:hypothetical protein
MISTGSKQGTVVGSCEHSNGPLGSIKDSNFHDQLSNYQLLKDSVKWSQLVANVPGLYCLLVSEILEKKEVKLSLCFN